MVDKEKEKLEDQLKHILDKVEGLKNNYGFMISGELLPSIFDNRDLSRKFLDIIKGSYSIIAYRLSPA